MGPIASDLFKIVRWPMSALGKLPCGKPSAVPVERVTNVTSNARQPLPVFTQHQTFHCAALSEALGQQQT